MGVIQEVTVGAANMGYTPAGNPRLPIPILPITRNYKGSLLAGSSYSIYNLIPSLTMGETVLIQTGAGSGDLRLGSVIGGGDLFVSTFVPYNLGSITGQDGWVLNAGTGLLHVVNVGGERMLGHAAYGALSASQVIRPLDTLIGAIGPYRCRWRMYRGANTLALNAEYNVEMLGTLGTPWHMTLNDMGTLNFYGNVVYTPGVGMFTAGWHDFEVEVNAAGVLLFYIDNVLVSTNTVAAATGNPVSIQLTLANAGGANPFAANYFTVSDFIWRASTLPTTGILIESGAGERLEAQLNPIDLKDLGIAVVPGGAAGLIEVMVIGR